MRVVLQRVTCAACVVEGDVVGKIGSGLLILLAVSPNDTPNTARRLAAKISKLRVFNDKLGKMNLSVQDVKGSILSISQFTLYAQLNRGNRPSWSNAATPEHAYCLYQEFNQALKECSLTVEEGVFGAHMTIELTNDGPVTLFLDSTELGLIT